MDGRGAGPGLVVDATRRRAGRPSPASAVSGFGKRREKTLGGSANAGNLPKVRQTQTREQAGG